MLKRVGALLLLLLFVLLLINIMFIGWQTTVSGAIYVVVFVAYAIFALRKNTSDTVKRNEEMKEELREELKELQKSNPEDTSGSDEDGI